MEDLLDVSIENEILIAKYARNVVLDISVANMMVKKRLEAQNGKDYPCLFEISISNTTKEARRYMKEEGSEGIIAGAFLIDDVFTKSVLNFFITVVNPKVPTKLFTSRDEAIAWLEQFKD